MGILYQQLNSKYDINQFLGFIPEFNLCLKNGYRFDNRLLFHCRYSYGKSMSIDKVIYIC